VPRKLKPSISPPFALMSHRRDCATFGGIATTASTCIAEQPHNTAYGLDFGGEFGNFSGDVVYQHYNQAISVVNPLLGPQSLTQPYQSTLNSINMNPIKGNNLIGTTNTVYGFVTDNSALMVAGKYTWNEFIKLFAGYEYIRMVNPSGPLGVGATAQGGYLLSGVEDNSLDSPKKVQVLWTGVKYSLNSQADITFPTIVRFRTTTVSRRSAAPKPDGALPARARSTSIRSIPIITSPSVSTSMPALRIPRSPAVWKSPFLTAPAFPITTTTTLLRRLVFVILSDAFLWKVVSAARA
jgi:hypothetical protein